MVLGPLILTQYRSQSILLALSGQSVQMLSLLSMHFFAVGESECLLKDGEPFIRIILLIKKFIDVH